MKSTRGCYKDSNFLFTKILKYFSDHPSGERIPARAEHEPSKLPVVLVQLKWYGSTGDNLHHRGLIASQAPGLSLHHLPVALVQEGDQLLDVAWLGHTAVVDYHWIT